MINSKYFIMIQRENDSANQKLYKNGAIADTEADASTNIPNGNVFVLALNVVGTGASSFSTHQVSCYYAGDYLSSGEMTAFVNAFETYMDSNGKGIIP